MNLAGLAGRYGVARWYRTDQGERVDVGRDTIVAVLDALTDAGYAGAGS